MASARNSLIVLFAFLGVVTAPAQPRDLGVASDSERRVALVIGNNDYLFAPDLRNAANDAEDLAVALHEVGFEVEKVLDADLRGLDAAVDRFISKLSPGDVALFHYSGHGMQVDGENYLIPVDFKLKDPASVRYDAYSASKLHDRMAGASSRLNIMMLDACRNNGFRTSRATSGGLAMMNAAEGSFIAFATGPGSTADDNRDGRNGLFTAHLLETLHQPGLTLDEIFNRVREQVYEDSDKRQLPWTSSSVIGDFFFRWKTPGADPVTAEPAPRPSGSEAEMELTFWTSIKDGSNPAMFEAYLHKYPQGHFAELARIRLGELEPSPPATQPAPVQPEPAPPAKPSVTLTVSPEAIRQGLSATLTWRSTGATTARISGIGLVPASGSREVFPDQTTTYTVTVQNSSGTAAASAVVNVTPAPASAPGGASPAVSQAPAVPKITVERLPVVMGDAGLQTRIARDIDELRALADSRRDRSYSMVTIPLLDEFQRIGRFGAEVHLRKIDGKNARVTLTLREGESNGPRPGPGPRQGAPSLRPDVSLGSDSGAPSEIEKKRIEIGQPIQFHVAGGTSDELVVLEIRDAAIVAYLAEAVR